MNFKEYDRICADIKKQLLKIIHERPNLPTEFEQEKIQVNLNDEMEGLGYILVKLNDDPLIQENVSFRVLKNQDNNRTIGEERPVNQIEIINNSIHTKISIDSVDKE